MYILDCITVPWQIFFFSPESPHCKSLNFTWNGLVYRTWICCHTSGSSKPPVLAIKFKAPMAVSCYSKLKGFQMDVFCYVAGFAVWQMQWTTVIHCSRCGEWSFIEQKQRLSRFKLFCKHILAKDLWLSQCWGLMSTVWQPTNNINKKQKNNVFVLLLAC